MRKLNGQTHLTYCSSLHLSIYPLYCHFLCCSGEQDANLCYPVPFKKNRDSQKSSKWFSDKWLCCWLHATPNPFPLSLPLSLSQGPFVSRNGHWARAAHTKAYFTGPSAVLWLVAVVGMFIDNKQLIRFLPNELPHAYQWKGCNLAPEPRASDSRDRNDPT